MLRIGQFSETFLPVVDGVGRVVNAYAETLAGMGHEITVVAPMNDTGHRGRLPFEIVDFTGFKVPKISQYRTGEPVMDPHYRRRMRMIDLDICHAHTPFMAGTEALRIAAQRNIPLVATFHSKYYDDFLKTTGSENLARIGTRYVVDFYNRCDEVWTVNDNTADVLRGYGYEGPIRIVENGVKVYRVKDEDIRKTEERYGLGKYPMLLFVGQMNWKKNILCVLEAAARLKENGRHFRLVLAGMGPDVKEISRKVAEMDLAGYCVMTGHVTDPDVLGALYARASLFVFPSLYDTSGMVVREAAVMGTPSVMVRGATASDTIMEDVNGFLCENDPADLARVLDRALNDEALLKAIGEEAQKTIPVSWDAIMDQVMRMYEDLIERNRMGLLNKKVPRVL